MSKFPFIQLLIGLVCIFIYYKKKMLDHLVISTIQKKFEDSEINKIRNRLRENGVELPYMKEADSDFERANLRKFYYRVLAVCTFVFYSILIINWEFNYVRAWYLLTLFGLLVALYLKANSDIQLEPQLKIYLNTDSEQLIRNRIQENKKSAFIAILIAIGLSINWGYTVQRNQSEYKLDAINLLNRKIGSGQCSNFWSQNAIATENGYEVNNSGGWPCITIGAVSGITFSSNKEYRNRLEMCFNYWLKRSNDGPWNYESSTEYDFRSSCLLDSAINGGRWSEYDLDDLIRKEIKTFDLSKLQLEMCKIYYYRMSYEEKNVYCRL